MRPHVHDDGALTGSLRSVPLPTNPAAIWTGFAWDSRSLADNLPYAIDAKAWLAAADPPLALTIAVVRCSPDLRVSAPRYNANRTQVLVDVSGGTAGGKSWVRFALYLSDGSDVNVEVSVTTRTDQADPATLPPVADPALDAVLTLNGEPVTFGGLLIPLP